MLSIDRGTRWSIDSNGARRRLAGGTAGELLYEQKRSVAALCTAWRSVMGLGLKLPPPDITAHAP